MVTGAAVKVKIEVKNLSVFYKGEPALKDLSLSIYANEILGIIGPANSGKPLFCAHSTA